jgi:CO/xanthine dehydrogenase Mo-binding subunit
MSSDSRASIRPAAPPAAPANVIYRAVGVRMRVLPMSPGRVVKEVLARGR